MGHLFMTGKLGGVLQAHPESMIKGEITKIGFMSTDKEGNNTIVEMKIVPLEHINSECYCSEIDKERGTECLICSGLFICKVCCGAEGSLPTHCPGSGLSYDQEQLIMGKKLDYKNGEWITIEKKRCLID